jgi:hypothetical protein
MGVSLSVCLMTRGPGGRVAAILELFRPVAEEIVVALDDRAEPAVAAALEPVADRLIAYPYAEPVDRPLPWLFRQCGGDWVLLWDDDEVPSRALLAALPELAGEGATGVWLPRRWLYPGTRSYLDEPPWRPDHQLRLLANDLRLLRFPDETHWQLAVLGPVRYADAPIYHADLVLNPLEARERKAERYERLLPGKRAAGRPLNEAYYLPERAPEPRTAAVPDADAALVERVLSAEAVERPAPILAVATREEIDRHWEGRRLGDAAYRARLEPLEELGSPGADEVRSLDVLVENLGDAVWPWGDARPEIRIAYRWWRNGRVVAEGLRTPLPAAVEPGESARVPAAVRMPAEPGRYRLAVDLVHEHVRWFDCGFELEVEVRPRRRLAVYGPVELARLPELEPGLEPLLLVDDPEALRGRYAGAVAPGAGAFLLAGLPEGRLGGAVLLVRTVRLLLSARRRRPGYARELVESLRTCEAAYVVVDGDRRRARLVARATVLAARALGLRTTLR